MRCNDRSLSLCTWSTSGGSRKLIPFQARGRGIETGITESPPRYSSSAATTSSRSIVRPSNLAPAVVAPSAIPFISCRYFVFIAPEKQGVDQHPPFAPSVGRRLGTAQGCRRAGERGRQSQPPTACRADSHDRRAFPRCAARSSPLVDSDRPVQSDCTETGSGWNGSALGPGSGPAARAKTDNPTRTAKPREKMRNEVDIRFQSHEGSAKLDGELLPITGCRLCFNLGVSLPLSRLHLTTIEMRLTGYLRLLPSFAPYLTIR